MADPAHVQTDALIEEIERKLRKQYARAAREIEEKLEKHLDGFRQKIEGRKQALKDGEITQQEYNNWFHGQIMTGRRWQALQAQISDDLLNANAIARKTAEGYKADVYALNVNFATYDVEHAGLLDTNFTLYDRDTVERIMREEPQLLPPPGKFVKKEIAEGKAERWNLQTFNSVMMQGIVQGESVEKLATRVSTELSSRNYAASVRYARTAMTSAQNTGRYEGYRRAQSLGVQLKIEWSATLDQRTRHDHRMLHGQRREIDEPFEVDGIKILYPAQSGPGTSDIPQSMIWNCRCTLLAWVKGFEGETVKSSPKMGDMTFEEWLNAKPMTAEQQDQWIRDGKPNIEAWKQTANYRKATNIRSDQKQYEEYKKILGKNAPKTFAKFQELKYNDAEGWDYTKRLTGYLRRYPNSDKRYFDVNEELKKSGINKGLALPPVQKNAYILPSGKREPYHIMHRMMERNITDDDLRDYIKDAKVMFVQWGGKRQRFSGYEGECVIEKIDNQWIYRTAWTKHDFDKESEKIMEVIKNVGL